MTPTSEALADVRAYMTAKHAPMILSAQIALACDGINIHTAILDHAILANGFATAESYEAMELECAERRLRSLADKIAEQRKRLTDNALGGNVVPMIAAE